jgi:ATP-dependent DNA helicase DinG
MTSSTPTATRAGTGTDLDALLDAAVAAVGGSPRPGQIEMAHAVAEALDQRRHLVVQAGTGTGKSLAYLVPALAHGKRVVIATATLALQRQLIVHDLPRIVAALTPLLGREPTYALLKGRSNYVCMHRVADGPPDDDDALIDVATAAATSKLGRDVLRVREWTQETETGDRDDLSPGVADRVWNHVSVSARECLGASRCPHADDCFAELAREHARTADIIVTNHALLAIDTFDADVQVLPEHDAVIIDEAHELVSRATGAASAELTPGTVARAVRRAARLVDDHDADELAAAADALTAALGATRAGRITEPPEHLAIALAATRDAARRVITELTKKRERGATEDEALRRQALAATETVFDVADRAIDENSHDVIWLEKSERVGASLHVAPLSIAVRLRDRLLARAPVVLTSATLRLGGDFSSIARSVGLRPEELVGEDGTLLAETAPRTRPAADHTPDDASATDDNADAESGAADFLPWRALDVGSPFDYPRQGILYIARRLPPPGRDGMRGEVIDEITALITAAGGRTLGLFSSMRAAETAADELRERVPYTVLRQGEDSLPELLRQFAADDKTCLFGTLSLWQGVNVPGPACQLVIIDRIPFPRPDDPLATARQEAVAAAGGNGFMAVAANHAALLLAQGAGRLIRSATDRGVVAVLDSRLATAGYSRYLRASLPPFWPTDDRERVERSLAAINTATPD